MGSHHWTPHHRKPRHHHFLLVAASIILTYGLFTRPEVGGFITHLGTTAYLGAFVAGLFFTTFATTVPSIAAFLLLADTVNPFLAAALGGLGATIGDFVLYRLIRDSSADLLAFFYRAERVLLHRRLRKRRLWHFMIPVLAGFIIASPLPDELAITLLGTSRFDPRKFAALAFLMNSAGILVILLAGQAI